MALMHAYAFVRADTLPLRKEHIPRKVLYSAGAALLLIFIIAREYGHHNTGVTARVFEFIGMTWMTSLFLICTCLLIADIVTAFGFIMKKAVPCIRYSAFAAGIILSAVALVQGLRPPVVTSSSVILQGLPPELDGIKAVFLTDLHIGEVTGPGWLSKRVKQAMELKPDIILLGGDIIEGHGGYDTEIIQEPSGLKARLGVYAVKGNHESHGRRSGRAELIFADAGIRLLINESVKPAPGLVIAGVEDFTSSRRQEGKGSSDLEKTFSDIPKGAVIFLSHTPWFTEEASQKGTGLMLCGHTHAGQVWPFSLLVRIRYPYLAGRYDINGMTLIVSRGTGTWGPRMRLWKPSEILLISLRSE